MKSRIIAAFILTAVLSLSLFAEQPPVQQWVARYDGDAGNDDEPYAMVVDKSGNIYVAGYTREADYIMDFALLKYDKNGNLLWTRTYDDSGFHDCIVAMALDNIGNICVTGWSDDIDTYEDIVTIKYDPNGNQLWLKRFNGSEENANDNPYDIKIDSSNNIYVTGFSENLGNYDDCTTIKYDANGNEKWVRYYNNPGSYSYDFGSVLALDDSNNVYVAGVSWGIMEDYITIKYDSNGNQKWATRYNGPENNNDVPAAIAVDKLGNVYVTGASCDINWYSSYATIKYDPNGNQLWLVQYKENSTDRAWPSDLKLDNSGNVYVTGETSRNIATIKYDSNGNQLWLVNAPNIGNSKNIEFDKFGNCYVTGINSLGEYATIKYDNNGNQLWMASFNLPNSHNTPTAMILDDLGNIYITGTSNGIQVDFATIKYTQHNWCNGVEGDINNNCKVDFIDYAQMTENWLNGNDWDDLAVLSNNWLQCNFALAEDCW